jgi:hypothetical protein
VPGSSPSQDKSIDFLHSTKLVVNRVRLPSYKYYLGKVFTYKLDRTTFTVGAPCMYAGDVYKPGFGGRLFFSLSRYRFFSTSSHARFRSALHVRRLRLDNSSRPLCHLRHKFFYSGGWATASLSRLAHRLLVVSFPLFNGVGWWNLLRELRIQLSVIQDKYSTTLLEELTS